MSQTALDQLLTYGAFEHEREAHAYGVRLLPRAKLPQQLLSNPGYSSVTEAIELVYHDEHGQPTQCCRYRLITQTVFGEAPKAKYWQCPGSPLDAYLPTADELELDWAQVMDDPTVPLIITEGEFKALRACQLGFVTVGLGGVDSWRSGEWGWGLLPRLKRFQWYGRRVYLCFDSDIVHKPEVQRALIALAERLCNEGALVRELRLPEWDTEDGDPADKCGLDDFLNHEGPEALEELIETALSIQPTIELQRFNDEAVYVRDLACVAELRRGLNLVRGQDMKNHYANRKVDWLTFDNNAQRPKVKQEPLIARWLEWPHRNEVDRMDYLPGHGLYVTDDHGTAVNRWRGWGTTPAKGDIGPFVDLFNHVFMNLPKSLQQWAWQWFAYPIQHPGTKLSQCLVVHGPQGSGKTLLGELVGMIYGDNYQLIEQKELDSDFNDWASYRQFIVGDEINGSSVVEHKRRGDRFKHLITGKQISVNVKFKPVVNIQNCINFYFTSNHNDAFHLEGDDRRYFICEVPKPAEKALYDSVAKWRDSGGIAHLHHHLAHLKLTDYDPHGHAPLTDAKTRMTIASQTDIEHWAAMIMDPSEPAVYVRGVLVESDLFTAAQLKEMYEADTGQRAKSVQSVTNALRQLGAREACVKDGQPQVLKGLGTQFKRQRSRLIAIRNMTKWQKATPAQCRSHYNKAF